VRIENGVFDVPLRLDGALEPEREALRRALLGAQRRLRDFAERNGWDELIEEPIADRVVVHADKARFDRDLLALVGMDTDTELPRTYCAALEKGVLVSMSPAFYDEVYPKGREEAAFEKLWTHELAHRLHVRILHGDEAAMGPVWFYEGFAINAAGQFATTAPQLEIDEIWRIVGDPERGDYARYATVFRHFAARALLPELVRRAGDGDFVDWLHGLP
jgi:hypothetical protein